MSEEAAVMSGFEAEELLFPEPVIRLLKIDGVVVAAVTQAGDTLQILPELWATVQFGPPIKGVDISSG